MSTRTTGKIKESPLFWPVQLKGTTISVLDETLLPFKTRYIKVRSVKEAVKVIRQMRTRAFGQFLMVLNSFLMVIRQSKKLSDKQLLKKFEATADALNRSRPTFPFADVTRIIIAWAKEAIQQNIDMRMILQKKIFGYLEGVRQGRLGRVRQIAALLKNGDSVLTHCNVSGELAMAAGICRRENKKIHYFATETRPYFQGAKLTAWELKKMGADVTLIADNAAGKLLRDRMVNKVIVGSDRSCANGDIANKIGTYQLAVLAREFHVPFYVLTQPSKTIKSGAEIPIEIRDENELLKFGKKRFVSSRVRGFYPGFDVVPHQLITKALSINAH